MEINILLGWKEITVVIIIYFVMKILLSIVNMILGRVIFKKEVNKFEKVKKELDDPNSVFSKLMKLKDKIEPPEYSG